jgi:hypothetical protein
MYVLFSCGKKKYILANLVKFGDGADIIIVA